jgi:hypothetical protein
MLHQQASVRRTTTPDQRCPGGDQRPPRSAEQSRTITQAAAITDRPPRPLLRAFHRAEIQKIRSPRPRGGFPFHRGLIRIVLITGLVPRGSPSLPSGEAGGFAVPARWGPRAPRGFRGTPARVFPLDMRPRAEACRCVSRPVPCHGLCYPPRSMGKGRPGRLGRGGANSLLTNRTLWCKYALGLGTPRPTRPTCPKCVGAAVRLAIWSLAVP